jgi:hypothetical protein
MFSCLWLSGSEYASAEELVNALNNQNTNTQSTTKKVSIKDEIKKQTTETKLTALYSNWKKNNNSDQEIEKLFEQQQQSNKTNGGQNVNTMVVVSRRIGFYFLMMPTMKKPSKLISQEM